MNPTSNGRSSANGTVPGPRTADATPTADAERVVRLTLRARGYELLAELPGDLRGEVREVVRLGGLALTLCAVPADLYPPASPSSREAAEPRNDCERDVLAVLAGLRASPSRRFVRPRIEKALQDRGMLHGACTLGNALARMVKAGLLVNLHDHKGYGLPTPAEGGPTP